MATTAPSAANAAQIVPREREIWVIAAAILPSSIAFIDTSALNVVLPILQSELAMSGAELLWVVNAYALFLSALILVGGSLGDHWGRKRVFMAGIALFIAASALCGVATSGGMLIAFRALQGIGSALMIPGSLAILTANIAPQRRGAAIGTWATFSALTTLFGAPLGGILASGGLWRLVFFINIPLGLLALWLLAQHVPESRDEHAPRQLDFAGALLITLALGGLTYGFTQLPELGIADVGVLLGLVGGALCAVLFVIVEVRSRHPMVPFRLFKSRTFSGTNLLTFFLYGTLGAFSFFLPLNLVQIQGYAPEAAGFAFLPFGITLAVLGRVSGNWVDRFGARRLLVIGPALTGIGYVLFALNGITGGSDAYWTTYFPAIVVMGIGMGITVAPLTTTVMSSAPAGSSGTASGINNAVSRVAGVLAVAIFGAVGLGLFAGALDTRAVDLGASDAARAALSVEASKLADADLPPLLLDELGAEQAAAAQTLIAESFVTVFQLLMWALAVLAWISALMAFLLVEDTRGATLKVAAPALIE